MAYPSSPEVRLEGGSGLDHLIKNTEFENTQHTKAIETEREKIKTYKTQLEEKKRRTVELDGLRGVLEEQAKKLEKQFAFNQENIESLKRTSNVLTDHEEALRRKLPALQYEVEQEHSEQCSALSKYEGIWASYRTKYESKEKVKLLVKRREELQTVLEHNAQLANQIQELEQVVNPMKQSHGKNSILVSWVLQIATLRFDTNHHLNAMATEMTTASTLRNEINRLEMKVREVVALLEKREMEAKQAMQRQEGGAKHREPADDVVTMETDAPPIASKLPPPDELPPHSDIFHQSPQQITISNKSGLYMLPHPGTIPATGKTRAPLFLQPRGNVASQPAKEQQQLQAVVKTGSQEGQQKKVSRFLLEMPQLSRPQRSISNQSSTPTAARAQLSSLSVARTNAHQPAAPNQRRPAQIQMPALQTPRPRLPSLAVTRHSSISTPTCGRGASLISTTSKPSLQIKMPPQVEISRPSVKSVSQTVTQQPQTSKTLAHVQYKDSVQPPSPSPAEIVNTVRDISPPKALVAESNSIAATAPQPSQGMQVFENDNYYSSVYPLTDVETAMDGNEGGKLDHDPNHVAIADVTIEPNAPSVPDMQVQKPLLLTTPTEQDTGGVPVNSSTMCDGMDMTDPSTYVESSYNTFSAVPQEMEANNSQDPAGAYPMYGGELYQQQNEQMQMDNTMGGQLFDGGISGFNQTAGGDVGFGGDLFTGQSSSSSDGGFFFGGLPATPQQQPAGSNGFGFSFGGGSTSNSNSPFTFSF